MRRWLFFVLLFLAGKPVFSQILEFKEPVLMPYQINSKHEDTAPLLSNDGKTLFFSRAFDPENVGGELAGMDIWNSTRETNGSWLPASNATGRKAGWNNRQSNVLVGVGTNDKLVYLLPSYKKGGGIAFSALYNNVWTTPEIEPIKGISRDRLVGYYVSPNFDVVLMSVAGENTLGLEDLYVCVKDSLGKWSAPLNLGSSINTAGFEISPFLTPDKKRLYFSSNGHKGQGDADIFFSDRLYDSWETWSTPRNLGPRVNSKSFDAYFSIYGDTIAYFASNRAGKLSDIYQVGVEKIDYRTLAGKNFLKENEINTIIGRPVDKVIKFDRDNTELSESQQELVWFVVNKLKDRKDIQFHIIAFRSPTGSQTAGEMRITSVLSLFELAGLENNRISFDIQAVDNASPQRNSVEILFYR